MTGANAFPNARRDDVKARARGQWPRILERLGVDSQLLNGKGHPCPVCAEGKDRFSFTDKFGHGDYFCRHCGHGDGFQLLQACRGMKFPEALRHVEELVVHCVPPDYKRKAMERSGHSMREIAKKIWAEAKPIEKGDEVDRYLTGRGLHMERYPTMLRCHPGLRYYERKASGSKAVIAFAAMVAPMIGEEGRAVTIHRTYLLNGQKAPVPDVKKVLSSFEGGPAIRLCEATDELAITEGVETALAVHIRTGKPVWAAYSASNMEKLSIPASIKKVCIYADNDANFVGQHAAYALARRLKSSKDEEREVCVYVPPRVGDDWADVLSRRKLPMAA
jgi:putative DNA primase/helicase